MNQEATYSYKFCLRLLFITSMEKNTLNMQKVCSDVFIVCVRVRVCVRVFIVCVCVCVCVRVCACVRVIGHYRFNFPLRFSFIDLE